MEIFIILGLVLLFIVLGLYLVVAVPILAVRHALNKAKHNLNKEKDNKQRQLALQSIDPNRGRVKVNLNPYEVEIEGYDSNSKLISVRWSKDSLLNQLFYRELEHAEWRMNFISKLQSTDQSKWKSLSDASWQGIRVLEERDRVVGTLLSEEQTRVIMQFADQALVSLYYNSTHSNNQSLCKEIVQELNKAEEDYEQAEDDIQRRSISTAIKTHQMRLKKQKSVEKNLSLVDSELKSLEATLKLVIEGIRSEISSHHLGSSPRLSPYDSALLELELPILDGIWQSTVESSR